MLITINDGKTHWQCEVTQATAAKVVEIIVGDATAVIEKTTVADAPSSHSGYIEQGWEAEPAAWERQWVNPCDW